ncbi:hypothetical protein QP166_07500 [Sphingomonas sp. LR60]|uniref:hypothetical protein n=1 Tax=Sphingomonas sp. LR60 TaxID=3050233 RepID=UPI002FDFC643
MFRRAGLIAMVASGVAMFTLSGGQIMAIHRAWVAYVAPGDEQEIQLYWGGARTAAIEREDNGRLVVERVVRASELPPAVRAALPSIAAGGEILMIEEVRGEGRYYEIYRRQSGDVRKFEVSPDGTPRHRAMIP